MKTHPIPTLLPKLRSGSLWLVWLAAVGLTSVATLSAADFTVTSPGFLFAINGQQPNPTLTLVRGETYTFAVATASNHPFRILAPAGTTEGNTTNSGTITFHVPLAATNYTYECAVHHFNGKIQTIAPPIPRLLSLEVSDKLLVRSTDTANFKVTPEFATNLTTPKWFALTVETNRVTSGTNETICGLPSGTNVFIRINASRN